MTKYQLAGQAIKKYHDGGSITDEELEAGITVLSALVTACFALGERYYLAHSTFQRILTSFEDFQSSRKRF